jgi:hypothetical protein
VIRLDLRLSMQKREGAKPVRRLVRFRFVPKAMRSMEKDRSRHQSARSGAANGEEPKRVPEVQYADKYALGLLLIWRRQFGLRDPILLWLLAKTARSKGMDKASRREFVFSRLVQA